MVWIWLDKFGVVGCVVMDGIVLVNLINIKLMVVVWFVLLIGVVIGEFDVVCKDIYVYVWVLWMLLDGNVWGVIVNKIVGDVEKFDDVVFLLFL